MNYQPSPKQALLLWRLITGENREEREPLLSKARPSLAPKERKPLVDNGFIRLEQRKGKRGKYLVLTDTTWAWAANCLDVEILKSPSGVGAEALQGLLRRLLPFLKQNDISLASLFMDVSTPASTHTRVSKSASQSKGPVPATSDEHSLPNRIEAACLSLSGGERKARVRLTALRERLSSIERDVLDRALLELQDRRRLVLYRDDNTAALTDEDRAAALYVGDEPRHLVYLEA